MDERTKDLLVTMLTYNPETDFEDDEAKETFITMFSELINSDNDVVKSFLVKLFASMEDILVDMGIKEPSEEEKGEEDTESTLDTLSEPEVSAESLRMDMNKLVTERANHFI